MLGFAAPNPAGGNSRRLARLRAAHTASRHRMAIENSPCGWRDVAALATVHRMSDLDTKLAAERDRLIQQLVGLADALNGLSPEQLADVLPIVAEVDAIMARVRKLGVPITTEYPETDAQPIDPTLLTGPLGGALLFRSN